MKKEEAGKESITEKQEARRSKSGGTSKADEAGDT